MAGQQSSISATACGSWSMPESVAADAEDDDDAPSQEDEDSTSD